MRSLALVRTALLAAAVSVPLVSTSDAAAVGEPNAGITGSVVDRAGPTLASFNHNSEGAASFTRSDSAVEPGSTARGSADLTYSSSSLEADAQGHASADTGANVRQSSGDSFFSKEFVVTQPTPFSATGLVAVASPPGHCCVVASAHLQKSGAPNVFSVVASTGDSEKGVNASGTLQPGTYTLTVSASAGMGFGAVGAANSVGSAEFDVAFTLSNPSADRDGDALLDSWETDGLDADGDGTVDVDLPAMGASPDHKDVFVELDCMDDHCLAESTIERVVDAFEAAPVGNPDNVPGISLHVDNGSTSLMDPATGADWGSLSESSVVPHQDVLGSESGGAYNWAAFDALKNSALGFPEERRKAFHYAISIHQIGGSLDAVGRSRGVDQGGSDFLISQGRYDANGVDATTGNDDFTANTFMHELGHNLALHHGGGDDVNNKPNYLSVMNYVFGGTIPRANGPAVLDYSRFEIPFDENSLDEDQGFGLLGGPAGFLTISHCPDGTKQTVQVGASPLDWDCSGIASGTVATDTNDDNAIGALTSQTDWDKLKYDGGLVGGKLNTLPMTTVGEEPTVQERLANQALLSAGPLAVITPAPGGGSGSPDPGGSSGPSTSPSVTVARLSSLRVSPRSFRRATSISYALDASSSVRFTVQRVLRGRRVNGRCRRNATRGPGCTIRRPVAGSVEHAGVAGANTLRLTRRLGGRRMRPGKYRLIATPAGGEAASAPFTIRGT